MKNETPIRRTAIGCLLFCLVVAALGCHGPRPRYGLLLRGDMSAELWKFPNEGNCEIPCEQESREPCTEVACTEEGCEAACPETICDESPCIEPACVRCGPRRRIFAKEAGESAVAPPPMIAARFFPVPTRPVFTPRGDLSNLNPYAQRMMPGSTSEVLVPEMLGPGTLSPERMPEVVPAIEVPASQAPEASPLQRAPHDLESSSVPSLLTPPSSPASRSNWAFLGRAPKKSEQEKVIELIASGSKVVK